MHVLIAYDVRTETKEGRRRLRRVAQTCKDFGQRVQYSVFECSLDLTRWTRLRIRLLDEIDPKEDSLRLYFLSSDDLAKTEHHGIREPRNLDEPLVI